MEFRFKNIFGAALTLSLLLHLLALAIIVLIVAALVREDRAALPEAIEFIFVPAEETLPEASLGAQMPGFAIQATDDQLRKAVPDALDLSPKISEPALATSSSHLTVGESMQPAQTPLTTQNIGADLAESSPHPNFLPNAPEPASLKSTQFYSPQRRRSIRIDEHFGEDARLSPPQLAIPTKKQDWLLKEMKKMTDHFVPLSQSDSVFVWEKDDARYEIKVRHRKAESASTFDKLDVQVRTERYGRTLSTSFEMQRVGFSQFAQFVDFWDPYVAIHNDKFDGRFHTNSDFKISSSRGVHPKFEGKVTSAGFEIMRQSDPFGYAAPDSIFQGGLETGTAEIKFPRDLYSLVAGTASDSALLRLESEAWLSFQRDGSLHWRAAGNVTGQGKILLPQAPFTILGESLEKLHVEGIVHGKVLIYNRGSIEITGNLIYAKSPQLFDDTDDFLGMVSEKNIEIAPTEKTGVDDLHVCAAMLARRMFRVKEYYRSIHKTLFIYGSLTAGSLSATEPRYATDIRFDKRLYTRRPPHFPMTDRYELQNWDGKWQVK